MRARWALVALALACNSGAQETKLPPAARPAAPAPAPTPAPPEEPAPPLYEEAAGVEYLELRTADADADAELPMIVAIHGLGDRPEHFAELVRALPFPARVILPRALDDHEGGYSWFPLRARTDDLEGLAQGITLASDKIAGLLAALTEARPTVGKPIVTGFSQGGMLSFALAAAHPEQIAEAVPIGGWLPPPLWPKEQAPKDTSKNPPVIALHGDADKALFIDNTRASVAHQRALGYDVTLVEYPEVGHQITAAMREQLYAALATAAARQASPGRSDRAKPQDPKDTP